MNNINDTIGCVNPNDDHVICPNCVHQFRAIPVNVQKLMLDAGFEPPFTTPPAQPAVQEGRDWSLLEATQESLREHMAEIKRLKAAQPAPVQEPVAWVNHGENRITRATGWDGYGALYTTPPAAQRQWVGLTDEEIDLFINGRGDADDDNYVEPTGDGFGLTDADLLTLVRRAEAKLKEKNA